MAISLVRIRRRKRRSPPGNSRCGTRRQTAPERHHRTRHPALLELRARCIRGAPQFAQAGPVPQSRERIELLATHKSFLAHTVESADADVPRRNPDYVRSPKDVGLHSQIFARVSSPLRKVQMSCRIHAWRGGNRSEARSNLRPIGGSWLKDVNRKLRPGSIQSLRQDSQYAHQSY